MVGCDWPDLVLRFVRPGGYPFRAGQSGFHLFREEVSSPVCEQVSVLCKEEGRRSPSLMYSALADGGGNVVVGRPNWIAQRNLFKSSASEDEFDLQWLGSECNDSTIKRGVHPTVNLYCISPLPLSTFCLFLLGLS